ncbi:BLOC-1-related complex subunit 6 [Toxorhynchites rutilus septentrionalis]|uniref:BLOC-1-related complex subunit 6 n=1 Tax=Toxorhynchites rutilus septentrionalis TaxID=329112 RepID=UPI00247AEC66|nr:BLOC-1-related complex subunit 6 [Toxorhynchites rutilus septentrionalis]
MSVDSARNPFIDLPLDAGAPSNVQDDATPEAPGPDGDELEDIPATMTESYSEIAYTQNFFGSSNVDEQYGGSSNNPGSGSSSSSSSQTRKRPDSLICDKIKDVSFPYNLEGTVRVDGNMTHFVAENLEYKIKLASPVTVTRKDSCNISGSRQSTPSAANGGLGVPSSYGIMPKAPHFNRIDPNVLNEIEREAQSLAASVDNLTESLCSVLHSISSITADNVEIYKNAVTKLTDCMDANIKCMYTIMAKAEEISKAIKPAEALAARIREIKRLVDMFESNI